MRRKRKLEHHKQPTPRQPKHLFQPVEIHRLTENEYLDDLALIKFKGDIALAAQYRGKTYGAITSSTYSQRSRGGVCLYYLNELKRLRDQLPPEKRKLLKVEIPIGYSKVKPRVDA